MSRDLPMPASPTMRTICPFPAEGLPPFRQQHIDFSVTAEKLREKRLAVSLELACRGARSKNLPSLHPFGEAFQRKLSQVAAHELTANQALCGIRNNDLVSAG